MSSSESEKDTIQNGDMFRNKKAEAIKKKPEKAKKTSKADSKTPKADSKTPKADSKKSAKDWTEEETTMLIEILESKPCLWDVHHAEYSKRDIKEIAYSEMASNFDTDIASIKQKLNNLRTRFGKELSKERNTKSGQATEELYNSNWPFFDQLAFLTPVIGASKSRDTLKRMSVNNNDDDDDNEDEVKSSKQRKPTVAEKKLDLLQKCTDAITANQATRPNSVAPVPKLSAFAVYIDEKLSGLNKYQRRIAEKRISDVLFDMEMMADSSTDEGTVNFQQHNQFLGYNFQAAPRSYQAMPRMQQPSPLVTPSRGGPQQRETANLEMQLGQSYSEYINE